MSSCYNVRLLIWRRLLVQTIRRHYLVLLFELAFVLCTFLFILKSDHVDLAAVKTLNRSFVSFHSFHAGDKPREEPTNVTVVYGPKNEYRDKLIAAVLEYKGARSPTDKHKIHNTVIRVDDAASVVTKCRQAITSRRHIPEYTYITALKRTLCVQFLDSGTADDAAKSLSYNLVVPLPSDASIPSGIVADLHDVLTDASLGYSSHEIKTITEEMYSWQAFIDEAHMNLQGTVANAPHIYVGTLPGNLPVEDIHGYRNGFFLALSVGFCLPLMWRIRDITTEIALGLKDMQELTGLSSNQFWLGHFLSALPLTLVDAALATSVVCLHQEKYRPAGSANTYRKDGSELPTTVPQPFAARGHARQYLPVYTDTPDNTTYLENADTSLVYASFALFAVCHTLLAFLIACVFPFGRWAMVIGFAVYFMFAICDGDKLGYIFMHSLYVYLSESRIEKLRRAALYPNVAFGTVMKIIGIFDDFEKSADWSITDKPALSMDNVTIREMWSIMGASACVFVVMIAYLSKVLPWTTANPQRPLFPLMRSYWAPREATFTEMLPAVPDMHRFQHRPAFGIVINCKDVVKTFGSAVALNKVSMTIHKFQTTILLGHNGAGKTTLMSIFTGLLAPDSGNVTVFGHRTSDHETRKSMGFCPQIDAFFDDLTVSDHLTYFGLLKGMKSSKIKDNVTALLKTVQLSDKPDALPSELSGGMKRRLSIAIALISKPQLLILDEPTVGLDPDARRVVWKILRDLRGNTTVLFSTHDMEEAEALADRIIVMYSGTVVSWGTPMFIKDACSVGFRLRISKVPNAFNSKAVLSTILKAAPMATLDDDNENEAVFVLNTMYREGFVDMFSELEANGQTMGIKNIGVSVATMKEAYIKIYKEWVGDAKKDLPPQKEVSEPVAVAPRQPNVIQRFRALVQKRLLILRRSPFLFITGWVLPVLVAFVGLSVVKQSSLNVPAEYQHIDLNAAAYVDADHGSQLRTFLEINNATNTSLGYRVLLESENVPFDELKNSKETLQAMFDENFLEYARAYAFGAVFNATALELWSNPFGVVAQSVLRNLIDTVLLRQHTGQARSRFSTGISLYRLTDEELYSEGPPRDPLFSLRQHLIYTWAYWAFMGSVCFGLILSSFVVLPSLEVVTGALELQLMTGVSGFLYLVAHFVFDLAFYAVPMTTVFVAYSAISELPSDAMTSLLVTALAFAPLGIFLAYLAAEHSSDGGTAYAIVLGLFAIAGPGVICGYLMAAFNSGGETTLLPFMFFPPFALSATTVRVVNLKYEVTICDYLRSKKKLKQKHFEFCNQTRYLGATIKYCCDILANKTNDAWTEPYALSFSPRGILQDVVIMLVMGAALFAYLLYRVSGWSRIGREMSVPPQQATKGPVDDDVAAERAAVADICRQQRFGDAGNVLVAQELHKVFGAVHAVRGLSFTLKPAECFGLLGVNGAGKTTTFRMLAGLLQMTYGEAYMKDSVLSRDARKVGALLGKLSAYETLYLFGRLRGVPEDKLAAVVENMINTMDLRDHAARMCNYYSGGDTRKLSMAVAMIGFPEVVLLDEPYDGVDVMGRERIRRSLGKIKSTAQSTVVLTSHSMDECELVCDRLCIMVEGEMVCLGTLQRIKDKFGRGYKLLFVRSDKVTVGPQALTESIVNAFPGITLVDVQWKCIECRTQDKLPWSQLFQKIDALDELYGFQHVFVSDNTLDQIFIAFARKAQENKAGGDAAPAANAKPAAGASTSTTGAAAAGATASVTTATAASTAKV